MAEQRRVLVAGGGGFIGSHLARRLKQEGHFVRIVDWNENQYFKQEEICHEFQLLDLRDIGAAEKACDSMEWVFCLAADMGGMGFIQSNHSVILYNNTMISFNMVEAARRKNVKKFFYSSSACIYPEHLQLDSANQGLKESDAWPANPQDAYGLEKIVSEQLCHYYGKDYPEMQFRVARFHNIFGPYGTWKGGREKAPAAFLRKAICCEKEFEMWGDGKQTRSFCYVDDCVEGILRLFHSDVTEPINIGSDEMVDMNTMADIALELAGKKDKGVSIKHIPGPEGVRGRNSDNTLIKKLLNWAPSISLRDGLARTYGWLNAQVEAEKAKGVDVHQYATSSVVNEKPKDVKRVN